MHLFSLAAVVNMNLNVIMQGTPVQKWFICYGVVVHINDNNNHIL